MGNSLYPAHDLLADGLCYFELSSTIYKRKFLVLKIRLGIVKNLLFVVATFYSASLFADSLIVDIDAKYNNINNPKTIYLEAGEYEIRPVNYEGGAPWIAMNAWNGGVGSCYIISGVEICSIGWNFRVSLRTTDDPTRISTNWTHTHFPGGGVDVYYFPFYPDLKDELGVTNGCFCFPNPAEAFDYISDEVGTFTVYESGFVDLFDPDGQTGDNRGGARVEITSINSVMELSIDIKPGSDKNPLKLNGHGKIPVAIFGSDVLDVSSINQDSLMLSGLYNFLRGDESPSCSYEYVNDDQYEDLICHFEDNSIAWEPLEFGMAELTGVLHDGTSIVGQDSFTMVGTNKGKGKSK